MSLPITFLHVTDAHIAASTTALDRDDHKTRVRGVVHDTREDALERTFSRIAEKLKAIPRQLDGVLFTGDAQDKGRAGGHRALLEMLLCYFQDLGINAAKIVAVPGNHDVPRSSEPSTAERYKEFLEVWRTSGCITPWLDGVDDATSLKHFLTASDNAWVVFPINSCNWSHAPLELSEPLKSLWDQIPTRLKLGSPGVSTTCTVRRSRAL